MKKHIFVFAFLLGGFGNPHEFDGPGDEDDDDDEDFNDFEEDVFFDSDQSDFANNDEDFDDTDIDENGYNEDTMEGK